MWTHCTFCTRDLGRNEVLETFPIGRRLAFDPAKGRLWAVCRRCGGWNLTPLEERWEAIEASEARFREARTRYSTGELGLARLSEGLELVRIGRPLRPEFAAWRYGDRFGRRRRRAVAIGAVLGGAGVAVWTLGMFFGGALGSMPLLANAAWQYRIVTRVRSTDGRILSVPAVRVPHAHLVVPGSWEAESPNWGLSVAHRGGRELLTGEEAVIATARLTRATNTLGGRKRDVDLAVERIEEARHPERFLREMVQSHGVRADRPSEFTLTDWRGRPVDSTDAGLYSRKVALGSIRLLQTHERLALEMALQEDRERRAMEGELRLLERAWKEAETIAAIADGLLPAPGAEEFIERHSEAGIPDLHRASDRQE